MDLEKKTIKAKKIIKQAAKRYPKKKLAIAWTGGKDSTALLHLIREVFGEIPFPVMFNDSTMEFEEIYQFIDKLEKEWRLNLIRILHSEEELKQFDKSIDIEEKKKLVRMMKISAINKALEEQGFTAFMVGIRWDEHEARSKEKYFSKRPGHVRIHPILHFTEEDVWEYIRKFKVPYVCLYDQGYRSLGEKPFTKPADAKGGERSGRDYDKEKVMQRLRALGYW